MFSGKPLILVLLAVSAGCAAQESQPPMGICSEAHPRSAGLCANPPKLTYHPDPVYSEEARHAGLEGIVRLRLGVTPEGRPEDIHVVKSLGMGLDEKAVEAVSQWHFQPAAIDGRPVAVEINVEVNFRLYDKKQTAKEDHGAVGTGELPESSGGGSSAADHSFRSGIALFRAKDYKAAANAMKHTVELEPSHLYAWNWLCRADYELGRIDEAVKAQIHKGLGMALDENSLAAVGKWKFQPGTYEGKPVPVATQVEMTFRLR